LEQELGITINVNSIFAAQIKRMHEVSARSFKRSQPANVAVQATNPQHLRDHPSVPSHQEGLPRGEEENPAVDVYLRWKGGSRFVLRLYLVLVDADF
jgi:hypothetical protein